MVVMICGKYRNNLSRTENVTERTRFESQGRMTYRADTIFKVKVEWPWRYRSRSNIITCDTPFHANDHLYQIWKESIRNCRCYRADTILKAKAKWPWRYRSRSKVIICNTPSQLVIICTKYGQNPSRTVVFFSRSRPKNFKICQKFKFPDSEKKRNTRYTL